MSLKKSFIGGVIAGALLAFFSLGLPDALAQEKSGVKKTDSQDAEKTLPAGIPTPVSVRVLAKDAKFVGTFMGGARVVIKDAATGRLLAEGVTAGSTGDTALIIEEDWERRVPLSTASSAKFHTVLHLVEPTLLEITATGPLSQPQAQASVSVTQWALPGKSLSGKAGSGNKRGDGILLTLPGFVVDILNPPSALYLSEPPVDVVLKVNVVMMCGCPIKPGGLWDADDIQIHALLKRNGVLQGEYELDYADNESQFALDMTVNKPGIYDITVFAYDPVSGNTGLDRTTFRVSN